MDDKKLDMQEISSTLMKLFVSDVFKKNDISKDKRKTLTSEQKEQLKKVVTDLQAQVENFVMNSSKTEKVESQTAEDEPTKNVTLRNMLKNKKS